MIYLNSNNDLFNSTNQNNGCLMIVIPITQRRVVDKKNLLFYFEKLSIY